MRLGRCDDASWLWSNRTEKKTKPNETKQQRAARDFGETMTTTTIRFVGQKAMPRPKLKAQRMASSPVFNYVAVATAIRCDAMLMAWINFNAFLHPLGDLENFKEFE